MLVAESFSGPIGYAIASNPPYNLKSVIFVSTFISSPNRILWLITKLPIALLLKIPIPIFIIRYFLLGKIIKNHTISLFIKSLKTVNSSVLTHRIREMAKLTGGVKRIDVKCAYIKAKNYKLVSRRHVKECRDLAPDIEVVEISGAHFIMQVNPKECAHVLKKHIALLQAHLTRINLCGTSG